MSHVKVEDEKQFEIFFSFVYEIAGFSRKMIKINVICLTVRIRSPYPGISARGITLSPSLATGMPISVMRPHIGY